MQTYRLYIGLLLVLCIGTGVQAQNRGPVGGLYLGTYFNGTALQKNVYYFAPDGILYDGVETGLSAADLARHRGERHRYRVSGNRINVTRQNGSTTSVAFNPADAGSFNMDGWILTRRKPFTHWQQLVGNFGGGESISGASVAQGLQLNPDGSYRGSMVLSVSTQTTQTRSTDRYRTDLGKITSNGGTWRFDGQYGLVFRDQTGKVSKQVVFPYEMRGAGTEMVRFMYAGGVMYKRE